MDKTVSRWWPWLLAAPVFLAGPVTAPLVWGCVRYMKAGRWGMALVCACGIVEFWTLGSLALIKVTALLHLGG